MQNGRWHHAARRADKREHGGTAAAGAGCGDIRAHYRASRPADNE
ncbi:protein of unknown function [Paraburkholderia kururiensis]